MDRSRVPPRANAEPAVSIVPSFSLTGRGAYGSVVLPPVMNSVALSGAGSAPRKKNRGTAGTTIVVSDPIVEPISDRVGFGAVVPSTPGMPLRMAPGTAEIAGPGVRFVPPR